MVLITFFTGFAILLLSELRERVQRALDRFVEAEGLVRSDQPQEAHQRLEFVAVDCLAAGFEQLAQKISIAEDYIDACHCGPDQLSHLHQLLLLRAVRYPWLHHWNKK